MFIMNGMVAQGGPKINWVLRREARRFGAATTMTVAIGVATMRPLALHGSMFPAGFKQI